MAGDHAGSHPTWALVGTGFAGAAPSRSGLRVGILFDGVGIEDGGGDVAFGSGFFVVEVVGDDDFSVGALDHSGVADVAVGAVVAEDDVVAPGFAVVVGEFRADAEGLGAVAVGHAEASVAEFDECCGVAFSGAVYGVDLAGPGFAVVDGAEGLLPTFGVAA